MAIIVNKFPTSEQWKLIAIAAEKIENETHVGDLISIAEEKSGVIVDYNVCSRIDHIIPCEFNDYGVIDSTSKQVKILALWFAYWITLDSELAELLEVL